MCVCVCELCARLFNTNFTASTVNEQCYNLSNTHIGIVMILFVANIVMDRNVIYANSLHILNILIIIIIMNELCVRGTRANISVIFNAEELNNNLFGGFSLIPGPLL